MIIMLKVHTFKDVVMHIPSAVWEEVHRRFAASQYVHHWEWEQDTKYGSSISKGCILDISISQLIKSD